MLTPCFKYPGGKRRMVGAVREVFLRATDLHGGPLRYVEPFAGSGVVGMNLMQSPKCSEACLSDVSPLIASLLETIRVEPDRVVNAAMRAHVGWYETTYYTKRAAFNADVARDPRSAPAEELWWLLKACFNGLFRTNRSGRFNAPWGKYAVPSEEGRELWAEQIKLHSSAIQPASVYERPWTAWTTEDMRETFLYVDPPYLGTWTGYSGAWSREDFHALAAWLESKPYFALSHSLHPEIEAAFPEDKFIVRPVEARSSIAPKGGSRGLRWDVLVYPRALETGGEPLGIEVRS